MRPPNAACELCVVIKCTQANYNNWDISIRLLWKPPSRTQSFSCSISLPRLLKENVKWNESLFEDISQTQTCYYWRWSPLFARNTYYCSQSCPGIHTQQQWLINTCQRWSIIIISITSIIQGVISILIYIIYMYTYIFIMYIMYYIICIILYI